jgi:prepilin-type N-terminal cleavage/methylation domain-containing protein
MSFLNSFRAKTAAFTLIELLAVLVVFGILASLVAPGFASFQQETRFRLSVQLLETDLQEAFFSARAKARIFGIRGEAGAGEFEYYECSYDPTGCVTEETVLTADFQPGVKFDVDEGNFAVEFLPPHGDLIFPLDISGIEGRLGIIIVGSDGQKKVINVYKDSGLIEITNYEPSS